MASNSTEIDDGSDLGQEQRSERLKWVLYGVGAMVFVLGKFFLQERVGNGVTHTCGLTILSYGAILYVHEMEHIRELWLWKGVATSVPLHVVCIFGLFWFDARFPSLAHSGFAFVWALFLVFAVELSFFLPIFEHFRPSPNSGEVQHKEDSPRPKGAWQAAADRVRDRLRPKPTEQRSDGAARITIAGEEDIDPAKEERGSHLTWGFGSVAALLLLIYLFRGITLTDAWLYILKISLFTALCFGHLLYVEEKDHIRESWVWYTALVTIPFHISFLGIMVGIDRTAPYLASNAIVFLFVIWAFGWVEMKLMDQIADDYQP